VVATWSEWDGTPWAGALAAAPVSRASGTPATSRATPPVSQVPLPYLSHLTAIGLSAVWRSVDLIASTIAGFPWTEWRGDLYASAEAEQLPTSRLCRRPMATMTRREWTYRVVAGEALMNTQPLLHVGGSDSEGTPWSLMPLPPYTWRPVSGVDPWGLASAAEYMVGTDRVPESYLTMIRRAPFPGMSDTLSSILDVARRQFQAYLAADTHMARYWSNGGPTSTVITTDQEIDDPTAEAIAARWVARRAMGADAPAVLGKGAHAEPWGADPTSQSAVEARREIVADIGRYFGLPTRILNAPAGDSETYSNVESDRLDLLGYCLQGYMDPVQDAISDNLPGDALIGRRMVMDPTRWLQGSITDRATAYSTLVTSGIVTRAEARVRGFGLPPVPIGGDTLDVPAAAPAPTDALPAAMATLEA
jgi:phage portal protein BeeE